MKDVGLVPPPPREAIYNETALLLLRPDSLNAHRACFALYLAANGGGEKAPPMKPGYSGVWQNCAWCCALLRRAHELDRMMP